MSKRGGYKLDEDLKPIMDGKVPLPNFEETEPAKLIDLIAAGGGLHVLPDIYTKKLDGETAGWGGWARYFLMTTQGGAYDGTGYVIWYTGKGGRGGRFAICKHEMQLEAGAKPSIGWRPGHCTKCDLNMTVDSGD